jgi:hypothetical protein
VVYSLRPFYGRARDILAALERGGWLETEGSIIPITLHWTWELADGFASAAKLAGRLAGFVAGWRWLTGDSSVPAE